MPCYEPRDDYDGAHNNVAAGLLCAILETFDPYDARWTAELRQWWEDHQNRDAYYARMAKRRR